MNKISLYVLLAVLVVLAGCIDSETSPKETYTFSDYTGSLSNAKIYWGEGEGVYAGSNDNFTYRTYFITDGDFVEGGDPWDRSDYTNTTYYMLIQLYVPTSSVFSAGDYPSWRYVNLAPAGESLSYWEVWLGSNQENERFQSVTDDTAVLTVSGKFNADETLTLEVTGQLGFYENLEGGGWTHTGMKDVNMFVTGKVIDIRNL